MKSERSLGARRVRVVREEGRTGLFYATSPDLKGLMVAEPTLDALEREIPNAIRDLYRACGEEVVVKPLYEQEGDTRTRSWVAFPHDIVDQTRMDAPAA
jgi:hypothetical protein